jgi:hypothetical protein
VARLLVRPWMHLSGSSWSVLVDKSKGKMAPELFWDKGNDWSERHKLDVRLLRP